MIRREALSAALMAPLVMPSTALEETQGGIFPFAPRAEARRFKPIDARLLVQDGWINPYKAALYPYAPDTAVSTQALQANFRRCYLLIQNKGPGNLFINFGMQADTVFAMQLAPSQFYELIGGKEGGAFVMRDSVWGLTDLAGTTATLIEGVAVPAQLPR